MATIIANLIVAILVSLILLAIYTDKNKPQYKNIIFTITSVAIWWGIFTIFPILAYMCAMMIILLTLTIIYGQKGKE